MPNRIDALFEDISSSDRTPYHTTAEIVASAPEKTGCFSFRECLHLIQRKRRAPINAMVYGASATAYFQKFSMPASSLSGRRVCVGAAPA